VDDAARHAVERGRQTASPAATRRPPGLQPGATPRSRPRRAPAGACRARPAL